MKLSRIPLTLAILLTLLFAITLAALYSPMHPLLPGTSTDFWMATTRVDLTGVVYHSAGSATRSGNYWVYTTINMHGATAYRVPYAEAMQDFPRVEAQLAALPESDNPTDFQSRAYKKWKSLPPPYNTDPQYLFKCVNEAIALRILSSPSGFPHTGYPYDEQSIADSIARTATFYPFNALFEFLFFSFLIWFSLYPFLKHQSTLRKLLHLAALPLLLYLPLWLGYCILTRTPWGPSGGILYPWFLWLLKPFTTTRFDLEFLCSIPPLLSPLNQSGPVTYSDFRAYKTSFDLHGPTDVALKTLTLLAAITLPYLIVKAHRHFLAKRLLSQRGFPIEPTPPTSQKENTPTP